MTRHFHLGGPVAGLFAALLLAILSGPARAQVLINEFEHTGTGLDRIEVYNTRPDTTYDLSAWYVENQVGSSFPLFGLLGPNAHRSFLTSGHIVLDGGLIELYDGTLLLPRDSVPYGDAGGAPLPPGVGSYSCGRAPDGASTGDPARDWNLDGTATFAVANDHPPAALGSTSVVFNEAGRTPLRANGTCPPPAVELHNKGAAPMNVDNWLLIDGGSITSLFGAIPPNGFLVISDFDPGFCYEMTGVMYLMTPDGDRVDQVGVHGAPLPPGFALSYQRIPDGSGPYDGYDFVSSGGGSTWFVAPETLGGTNQPDPGGVEDGFVRSSWGSTKAEYR